MMKSELPDRARRGERDVYNLMTKKLGNAKQIEAVISRIEKRPWMSRTETGRYILAHGEVDGMVGHLAALPFIPTLAREDAHRALARSLPVEKDADLTAWSFGHAFETLLNVRKRTGNLQDDSTLDNAVESVLALRDDRRGRRDALRDRILPVWSKTRPEGGTVALVALTGRIATAILEYAIERRAEGRPVPDRWIEDCRDAVAVFIDEMDIREDRAVFRAPQGGIEPLNHGLSIGRAAIRLIDLTGEDRFVQMAERMARFHLWAAKEDPGNPDGLSWGYIPTHDDPLKQFPAQFWKADIDISFVVEAERRGIVYERTHLERMAETFRSAIVDDTATYCLIASSQKHRLPVTERGERGTRLFGICEWINLLHVAPWIEDRIDMALARDHALFPGLWLGNPRATMAYSKKMRTMA